ncbi:MAG TPA: hypothetical protein DCE14_02255 [Kosmotogaceae bacterium]|nr:MAG: Uncharacterized protein XE05_1072 [Thermotogales bacterium 46_20]HAA85155.1 hypothetical protein [Kosmotogaceae bacterium]
MRRALFAVVLFFVYIGTVSYFYLSPIAIPNIGRHSDKVFHFLIFLAGGVVFLIVLRSHLSKALSRVFGISLLAAPLFMELIQDMIPYRVHDPKDIIANYAGLAVPIMAYLVVLIIKKISWTSWLVFFGLVIALFITRHDATLMRLLSRELALFFDIGIYFATTSVALHIMFSNGVRPFTIIPEVLALVLPTVFLLDHRLTPLYTYTRRDIVFGYSGVFTAILLYSVYILIHERKGGAEDSEDISEEQRTPSEKQQEEVCRVDHQEDS